MIKETSRCGHQNVHAFLKLSDLWIDVDSAKTTVVRRDRNRPYALKSFST